MRQLLTAGWVVLIGLGLVTVVGADEPKRDTAAYVDDVDDPVIDEMEAANEAKVEAAKVKTEELLEAYHEAEKARTEPEQTLRFDLAGLVKPENPEAFSTRLALPADTAVSHRDVLELFRDVVHRVRDPPPSR